MCPSWRCCNGVVAEAYAQVTLRVELETGELLVWADLVDGRGVKLQLHLVHAKHDTPHDKGVYHDKRDSQLVASVAALQCSCHALKHGHVLAQARNGDDDAICLHRRIKAPIVLSPSYTSSMTSNDLLAALARMS